MRKTNIFIGLVGAALVGAVAGVLFAPRKGRDTRENLAGFMKSHYPGVKNRRLSALADQIARDVNNAKDDLKDTAKAAKAAAKESAKQVKEQVKERIAEIKNK